MTGFCEHGNGPSGFINNVECPGQRRYYGLAKELSSAIYCMFYVLNLHPSLCAVSVFQIHVLYVSTVRLIPVKC
jgi:hypothetical protein